MIHQLVDGGRLGRSSHFFTALAVVLLLPAQALLSAALPPARGGTAGAPDGQGPEPAEAGAAAAPRRAEGRGLLRCVLCVCARARPPARACKRV